MIDLQPFLIHDASQAPAPVIQADLPMTRRRRLLAPTPLKVRLALGQEDVGEENIDPELASRSDGLAAGINLCQSAFEWCLLLPG